LGIQTSSQNELVAKHHLKDDVYQKISEIANGKRGKDLNELIRCKTSTVFNCFQRFEIQHEKLKGISGKISVNNVECE